MAKRRSKSPPKRITPPLLSDSDLEESFRNLFLVHGLTPIQQYKFHPVRNWRFDFCWPVAKLAIEVQGYGPGHNSYVGMTSDYEKHNAALILGWRILYFMAHDVDPYNSPNTIALIRTLITK